MHVSHIEIKGLDLSFCMLMFFNGDPQGRLDVEEGPVAHYKC